MAVIVYGSRAFVSLFIKGEELGLLLPSALSKAAKKEAAETRCTIIGIMLLGVCRELAEQHTCHTKRAEAVA